VEPQRTPACNFTYKLQGGGPENDLPCLVEDESVTSFWKPEPDDDLDRAEAIHVLFPAKPDVELGFGTELERDIDPVPLERAGRPGEGWTASVPLTDDRRAAIADGQFFILRVHSRPTPAVVVWVA
jgi:hypothetical protein